MKIVTIIGTRPEIIRLSCVIPLLDKFCNHTLVYTDQNYDKNLKDIFFENLNIRQPDYFLNTKSDSSMEQIGKILEGSERVLIKEKPDKLLILGDTNSALSAFVAKRLGIPVYHMEAGNRCYDDKVPEEVNRKVIDHCSSIHMPYTERSRNNLIKEGIDNRFIYVTGNPIKEVISKFDTSSCINPYSNLKPYFLVTLHRAENVDNIKKMATFIESLKIIGKKYCHNIIFSTHPRTESIINKHFYDCLSIPYLHFIKPVNFEQFLVLEKEASCIFTDSGTVQEECHIMRIPNVTFRDNTERQETLESGSNILAKCSVDSILKSVEIALDKNITTNYSSILDYEKLNVSETVLKIMISI